MTSFDLQSQRQHLWLKLVEETKHSRPFNRKTVEGLLNQLEPIEHLWAYPGLEVFAKINQYFTAEAFSLVCQLVQHAGKKILSKSYRFSSFIPFSNTLQQLDKPILCEEKTSDFLSKAPTQKPYFEVLIVHPSRAYEPMYRQALSEFVTDKDEFLFNIVFVEYAKDALIAILSNPSIQACVCVAGFGIENPKHTPDNSLQLLQDPFYIENLIQNPLLSLVYYCRKVRPELDLFFISEVPHEVLPLEISQAFDRILFQHPFQDLHYCLLNGIRERFSTPFFHALQAYSRKPMGSFHALPVSRAQSIQRSPWTQDMLEFYGPNVFLAETSSTQGGLDSLLAPKGAIKQAHDKAAKTFGSQKSFFITNGTSTANKIVMQATLKPEDIVLISSDCHKSIPYAVVMTGAIPIFLETYSLKQFDLYGGVKLARIIEILLDLKAHNQLHRVKQITLTNSTFDGLLYHTEQFMRAILEIKPDIIFHWDEAWFAFGYFNPLYQDRCAMKVAKKLSLEKKYPIRVYATQSTHKTMTAFRQGSMIHIFDEAFEEDLFIEAYRMHTSTSPNYQLLASLDIGRRQMALEGFELTQKALYLANVLKQGIQESKTLKPYFRVLETSDLVPTSKSKKTTPSEYGEYASAWDKSEFVVDPTRITLDIRPTGMDGSHFRELLINRYHIQVNKTSFFTVLFIVTIGATESSIQYLLEVLHDIAERLQLEKKPEALLPTTTEIELPQKRRFHPAFQPFKLKTCEISDVRTPHYLAFDHDKAEYVALDNPLIKDVLNDKKVVSATFVTPYPPGFPLLVPGQIITYDILIYLQKLKTKEIHGYKASEGLKVFKDSFLEGLTHEPT